MDAADLFVRPPRPYLLSHSVGLMPVAAQARLAAGFLDPWAEADGGEWTAWLNAIDDWRAALGRLIGAAAGDLCPQANISSGLTKIIHALPARPGRRRIVATEDDFPTIGFVLEQARRAGYEPLLIPGGERLADPDAWAPAFRDDVQLVLATHVFSNSSRIAPIAEIIARARAAGACSVIDLAQSAGCVPVDLARLRPDFALGTSVKFLCGGPGACFLYADPEAAARCAPLDVGWFSHEAPFEFDIRRFRFAAGAARFWGGTPSVAPYALALAGLDAVAAAGIDAICAHNRALIGALIDRLGPRRCLSETRAGLRGSSAIIGVADAATTSAALAAAGVRHDLRQGGVRVSAHLYNSQNDIEALCHVLERSA